MENKLKKIEREIDEGMKTLRAYILIRENQVRTEDT